MIRTIYMIEVYNNNDNSIVCQIIAELNPFFVKNNNTPCYEESKKLHVPTVVNPFLQWTSKTMQQCIQFPFVVLIVAESFESTSLGFGLKC